jgi:hypothetical protein
MTKTSTKQEISDDLDAVMNNHFTGLYLNLNKVGDTLFDWMNFMHKPHFWQLRKRRMYREVYWLFAMHGLWLTDTDADKFLMTRGQQPDEDYGGSIVRRLREVWQYQMGVPFSVFNPKKGK